MPVGSRRVEIGLGEVSNHMLRKRLHSAESGESLRADDDILYPRLRIAGRRNDRVFPLDVVLNAQCAEELTSFLL